MEQYKVEQTIYFKKDMTIGYIKSCLVEDKYLVKKEDNTEMIVSEKDITRDIDLVIKTLKNNISQLEMELQDSRDSWWRLKDEAKYNFELYNQQKKINEQLHLYISKFN
tara:strand:- start:489 stop:815 length:327 start_codon:yes stop_codon:yes gene_type:complete